MAAASGIGKQTQSRGCDFPPRIACALSGYFIGKAPVWAELRASDQDVSRGSLRALEVIVAEVRLRCPQARIIVRAGSGFCREELMAWCEAQEQPVYYCLGLARNKRLCQELEEAFFAARAKAVLAGGVARVFRQFDYRTLESWSRARRVIGKAEVLQEKNNARFIVTNLPAAGFAGDESGRFESAALYEGFYCARGNMENQIKQQLLDLNADRMSTHFMASNQLRLWLSTFACFLVERLRALALKGTSLERATAGTIRLRLLKIGALLTVSVRRVHIRLASGFALQEAFKKAAQALGALSLEPATGWISWVAAQGRKLGLGHAAMQEWWRRESARERGFEAEKRAGGSDLSYLKLRKLLLGQEICKYIAFRLLL